MEGTEAKKGLGLIKKFREERLSSLRPLPEFFNTTRMSKPNGLASMWTQQKVCEHPLDAPCPYLLYFGVWSSSLGVASRLSCNLSYFRGNYTLVFLGITAYSLCINRALKPYQYSSSSRSVSNAMLMFSVGFVVGGTHLISKVPPEGLMLGENRYNKSQLQTGMACIAVPLFFFSSTIGTIFYIVGASAVTILGHAAFMEEHIEGDFADTVV
ncbi:hypothetical protein BC939DRAFT_479326 [Gamsiella multidivaricata]|uniref:uncharacterized protein n=1 Tax=Gamsiella multidivaricata TaxID=101098 RepID=UPI00221EB433|nr:uncharacterized protein BC939DRAFT_479326 [Gamsiella multidivaricata]KAI7819805.1 hypothetical protein BC939DRAFT_479326 [Gamsiella multidivaricata]